MNYLSLSKKKYNNSSCAVVIVLESLLPLSI